MGSSPSAYDGQQASNVRVVTKTARRKGGFQEIQFSSDGGGKKGEGKKKSGRSGADSEWQRVLDKVTDGKDTDLYSIVRKTKRKKKKKRQAQQPNYGNSEELFMETFYHNSGTTYSCFFQNGQRFYLDSFESMDWQPFPVQWYDEGALVTDQVTTNEQEYHRQPYIPDPDDQEVFIGRLPEEYAAQQAQGMGGMGDDREGSIDLPEKGKTPSYIFEERRNIHYFFDKDSGCWIKLPIAWELHSELITKLLLPVEEAMPNWKDKQDMLAALRYSNYDPHDCIASRLALGESAANLAMPRNADDMKIIKEKDEKVKEYKSKCTKLNKRMEKLNKALNDERADRRNAETLAKQMQEKVSALEAEAKNATTQLESLQSSRNRPKTASSRSGSRGPDLSLPVAAAALVGAAQTEAEADTFASAFSVEPSQLSELNDKTKLLRKDFIHLKMDIGNRFKELRELMKQTAVGVTKITLFDHGQSQELEDLRDLYRKEALQRKMLYNKLQELRGNIRVYCRCRYDDRVECALEFPSDREIRPPEIKKAFKFDRVFTPDTTQEEVYDDIKAMIVSCVDGYNVCILAYGQTGSGKTHTMMGTPHHPGVNVRAIKELLKSCGERDNVEYTLKASMVEIYNEHIQDLLSSDNDILDIRSKGNKIHLPGMTEMFVETFDDIEHIIHVGSQNRSVGATKMNSSSSRSHLIFMIVVEGIDKASGASSSGMLSLCDLAGSERVSKTEASGQRLVEAAAINKSLTSLGQVFTSLRTSQLHVPYRNSKLTHMLQPCLGGDAKAALFVTVSPDEDHLSETMSTLQFGSNAKQVQLGQAKKNIHQKAPPKDAWFMDDAEDDDEGEEEDE